MTEPKRYDIDTTANRVVVTPRPGGIVLKFKPKRGRAWMEFKMPDHVANMVVRLIEWGIEEKFEEAERLTVDQQNDRCVCKICRQLRVCAKLGMAPTATKFPDDHMTDRALCPTCSQRGQCSTAHVSNHNITKCEGYEETDRT